MATSKAPTSQFVCVECGYTAPKWLGKCPGCGNFNTMQEELIKPAESAKKSSRPALSDMGGGTRALPLSKVGYEKFKRVSSGESCGVPSCSSAATPESEKAPS